MAAKSKHTDQEQVSQHIKKLEPKLANYFHKCCT